MATPQIDITADMKAVAEAEILVQQKRIEFYTTEWSIRALAEKMQDGDLFIPDYQRMSVWEPERKSRFIESLLMGLQIPFIFFWERDDGKLEIVDGSQRLRTLQEFVLGGFRLQELEALPSLSGFAFADLSDSRQRKIGNRSIRGIVLNEHADEQARFDMFERINTGPKVAKPAEVRRGALAGPFMDLVIDLADQDRFHRLAPVSAKVERTREYEELAIRFFAYSDGLVGYRDRPSQFIFEYAKGMNAELAAHPGKAQELRDQFDRTMAFVERNFPYGFRKGLRNKATPRARFEAIAIGSWMAIRDRPGLENMNVDPSPWLEGEEFRGITGSDGANAIARLRGRMEFVRDKLLAV